MTSTGRSRTSARSSASTSARSIALLPLPASEATIESIEHSGSGDNVVLRLVGESEEVLIQTRWKDRDGKPTVIEASHLTSTAIAAASGEEPAPLEEIEPA